MRIEDSTICITGGNGGLGSELCKLLIAKCKKIYVVDKEDQSFFNPKITYIQMDLLKEKPDIKEVDILISNLGMTIGPKKFLDTSSEEVKKMIDININLSLWLLHNIKFKKVIFINSVTSFTGLESYSLYCASKAFMKVLNQSIRREGVDSMIVYPYKINTNMFSEIKDLYTLDAKYVAKMVICGIEKDRKEIYLPFVFRLVEMLLSICPTFLADIIIKYTCSVYIRRKNKKE